MSGFPARYIVFDTESTASPVGRKGDEVEHTLRLGIAATVDPVATGNGEPVYSVFRDADTFTSLLLKMPYDKRDVYVFAHNMGFDARISGIMETLAHGTFSLHPPSDWPTRNRYREPLFICESPPFIMRLWRSDGQKFLFLDTYQWVKEPLATIGEMLGIPKWTMPPESATDSDWEDYCANDVFITLTLMRSIWGSLQRMHVGDFQYTPASQSALLYQRRFCKGRIHRPENTECLALDRHAYYGGRVECYSVGAIEYQTHQIDCNAMYPWVMKSNLFPCRVEESYLLPQKSKPWNGFVPARHTAEVWLESEHREYPVRTSQGTYYARGRVRTILCGPELDAAMRAGHVVAIGRHVCYELEDLFTPFVHCMYRLRMSCRERDDSIGENICKTMMNSLHGKFGQRSGEWQYMGREFPPYYYGTGKAIGGRIASRTEVRVLAGHTYYRAADTEADRSFVPIAAWTASYAREYMANVIATAFPGSVHYQATDSLIVDDDGLDSMTRAGMVSPDKMGLFKHQGSFSTCEINGIGNIRLGSLVKRSGVRRNAKDVAPGIVEQEDWESFQSSLFRGNCNSVSIRTILKRTARPYDRGTIDQMGRTAPFLIDNWELPPEDQKDRPLLTSGKSRE